MVDIFNYIKILKITWLRKLETKGPKWKPILYAFSAVLSQLHLVIIFQNVLLEM